MMRNGLIPFGLSLLDIFGRLIFFVDNRTFCLAIRKGLADLLLLACFACLNLKKYRLCEVS